MRIYLLFLLLTFSTSLVHDACYNEAGAQSRSERRAQRKLKKKWKKVARNYRRNPLALKAREEAYQEQIQTLTEKNNELTQRYTELQAQLDQTEAQMRQAKGKNQQLEAEIERLRSQMEILREQQQQPVEAGIPGLVFRVQVGAYNQFDMTRYNEYSDNFTGETADNLNKYLMGKFRDYENARAFRDDIRKLGIRDAFVVAYNDGTRIDIKEALRLQNGGTAPANEGLPGGDGNGGGGGSDDGFGDFQ